MVKRHGVWSGHAAIGPPSGRRLEPIEGVMAL